MDGAKTLFDGKAPFVTHEQLSDFYYRMPNDVTIALLADRGAHNDAAARVAAQVREQHPDLAIHLGDIYYAGQEDETRQALSLCPLAHNGVVPPRTSIALNGNHEMFSGGKYCFGTLLHTFGQDASYFGLYNDYWQILAFDSAYIDHRPLSPDDDTDARLHEQWAWLVDKMDNNRLPKILLCHHQPVSAFTLDHDAGATLRADFQKFLAAAERPVFGWFFGHAHRCTIYEDDGRVPYLARLIGHGCIPHTPPAAGSQHDPGCIPFRATNTRTLNGRHAVCGYALLRFDDRTIGIQYLDEDGQQFIAENWIAPLPD